MMRRINHLLTQLELIDHLLQAQMSVERQTEIQKHMNDIATVQHRLSRLEKRSRGIFVRA
ncbi:hypothetical protein JFL43_18255 [Viridibacillus sp. YIM B01967]|uniref:Uncharacterized protein n=1 Tax=Viridibacillus soli TaxID=2798301 RepID=A0ABS1HBL4_9BACL|nr:hypothetical protein [Viridibacillus soli]MBK3496770.1 hypothetical protein [Viridibacillus soli]